MSQGLWGKQIFIVEDNADNIYVMLSLLRRAGAHVQVDWWAKGECERLEMALPIDLIILDLMLPHRRTGFEVYDEIRQRPALDNVPIVAVSAMDPAIALPRVQAQGFSGFISKPLDFYLFPQQIAALIAGEQVWYAQ